jgi:hypothetical protein
MLYLRGLQHQLDELEKLSPLKGKTTIIVASPHGWIDVVRFTLDLGHDLDPDNPRLGEPLGIIWPAIEAFVPATERARRKYANACN